MFLKANLQVLLELLQDSEELLSEEAVTALSFVLSSARSSGEGSNHSTLLDLAVSAGSHSGYSKVGNH